MAQSRVSPLLVLSFWGDNMVSIDFEFETKYGKFADAISYDETETTMTDEEVEVEKQRRLNNWIALVTASGV